MYCLFSIVMNLFCHSCTSNSYHGSGDSTCGFHNGVGSGCEHFSGLFLVQFPFSGSNVLPSGNPHVTRLVVFIFFGNVNLEKFKMLAFFRSQRVVSKFRSVQPSTICLLSFPFTLKETSVSLTVLIGPDDKSDTYQSQCASAIFNQDQKFQSQNCLFLLITMM